MKYRIYEQKELGLGDLLALDRTRLANERTFLAYLRAAIMIGLSSITIIKLFPEQPALLTIAWATLPFSFLLGMIGFVRSFRLGRSLRKLEQNAGREQSGDRAERRLNN